ncbi:hypothetical protein BKA62DRAFT_692365 [Auriculariales sp. MPI-PUGE-AT-0066]|nr:hypothetical protein BKA62DRAFT_692365 [Auriculariales sp. MPI-PUGE-AT-0066]
MSFGRPPQLTQFSVLPPDRGSSRLITMVPASSVPFELPSDLGHLRKGECKTQMMKYMACLKANGNNSLACRAESGGYLDCRMKCGLMEQEEWKNLGLSDVMAKQEASKVEQQAPAAQAKASAPSKST